MAEKKKTFKEQLDDPLFEALGGLNIFDMPTPGEARKRLFEAADKKDKKEKNEDLIDKLPKGSKGYLEAKDKTIIAQAEDNNEVSLGESVSNAIVSGVIQIPYGWAQLTAEIMDAVGDDVPVDKTKVAKLDAWFDQTIIGQLQNYSEEKAKATGTGRIVEFMTELYGNWRAAGKPLSKLIDDPSQIYKKSKKIADKLVDAKKNGRYISSNSKNLKRAYDKTKDLNFGKRVKKWTAVAIGGGVTGGLIADAEDIGTWGDWLFEPGHYSSMHRVK